MPANRTMKWLYTLTSLALFVGVILTILSWLNICTEECKEEHTYRLFGAPFEWYGIIFFSGALLLHAFAYFRPSVSFLAALWIFSGVGAEIFFIIAQKYIIGAYCPVCLTIAFTVLLASLYYGFFIVQNSFLKRVKGGIMKSMVSFIASFSFLALGFIFALSGLAKFNQLQATEAAIKEKIKFGDQASPIEILIFTDWACPACRQIEPTIAKIAPKLFSKASVIFVDCVIHQETLNFAPYNLSYMVHNKEKYLQLRKALGELAKKTGAPTDKQIEKISSSVGVNFKELSYADIALAQKYFEDLSDFYHVTATPTIVLINKRTQQEEKLQGASEITPSKVHAALESLSKS